MAEEKSGKIIINDMEVTGTVYVDQDFVPTSTHAISAKAVNGALTEQEVLLKEGVIIKRLGNMRILTAVNAHVVANGVLITLPEADRPQYHRVISPGFIMVGSDCYSSFVTILETGVVTINWYTPSTSTSNAIGSSAENFFSISYCVD